MRILALDDEIAFGQLIRRVAQGLGLAAETTVTAAEFRTRFSDRQPDAIVLDLHIGEDDGVEQLRFLSASHYSGPILLLSGLDERLIQTAQQIGQALGLTVTAALVKPIRVELLRGALKSLQLAAAWSPSPDELHRAIAADALELHFQPIVAAGSRRTMKVEALARWNHPERGLVSPDRFIAVAESEPEVIDALTLWAAGKAAQCQQSLAGAGADIAIAVNISSINLRALDFADRLHDAVRQAGGSPDRLGFELTETAAFQDVTRTADILLRLRIKGFELALDDFGTGYSSLKVLKQLPFSALKIDRSFITDLLVSRDSASIVRAIIDLARHMELQTVAEGVETESVAAALEQLGIGFLQGYHISRPLSLQQLATWLA